MHKRITSIDFTRGLVMIIMALDHTRDLMHTTALTQNPTDVTTTTPLLFFTRWVTHFCAPTFVFLAGISAYIAFSRKKDLKASRNFLITRGLWLVVVEFTIVNFSIWFDPYYREVIFEVIGAIGLSMVILGLLLKLPAKTIGIIGLVIIFLHDAFVYLPLTGTTKTILSDLFLPGAFPLTSKSLFIIGYPLIPWLGILLAGFGFGTAFNLPEEKRKPLLLKTGIAALVLFVIIRWVNIYGDTTPWAVQPKSLFTFLSFINITKYPPTLCFTLLTLSFTCIVLAVSDGVKNRLVSIVTVYGKVPLAYFIVHFLVLHCIMLVMMLMQGYHWADLNFQMQHGRPNGPSGVELGGIYVVWITVVIALYPLCKLYGKYKAKHPEKKWLSYL